jgi:hypothetical protein
MTRLLQAEAGANRAKTWYNAAMNELTNQIERLQGRVHETMVRL